MNCIFAMDPPSKYNLGWAKLSGKELKSGNFAISQEKNKYLQIIDFLELMLEEVDVFFYEHTSFGSPQVIWSIAEIVGIAKCICIKRNILILSGTPGQIKKAITGNGRASKSDVMAAVSTIYGEKDRTEHEADALAILFLAQKNLDNV